MTLHELFPSAAAAPKVRRLAPILRWLVDQWWLGVRMHVAEVHGLPPPREPPPPIWPFSLM